MNQRLGVRAMPVMTRRGRDTRSSVLSGDLGAGSFRVFDRGQWKEAKVCAVCARTFTNRRKWKQNNKFASILYCSDRCRNVAKKSTKSDNP